MDRLALAIGWLLRERILTQHSLVASSRAPHCNGVDSSSGHPNGALIGLLAWLIYIAAMLLSGLLVRHYTPFPMELLYNQ